MYVEGRKAETRLYLNYLFFIYSHMCKVSMVSWMLIIDRSIITLYRDQHTSQMYINLSLSLSLSLHFLNFKYIFVIVIYSNIYLFQIDHSSCSNDV